MGGGRQKAGTRDHPCIIDRWGVRCRRRPTHRDARTRAGDIATGRDVRLRIDRIDETTTTTVVIGDDGRHDDGDGSVCVFRGDAVFNGNDDDDDDDDDNV